MVIKIQVMGAREAIRTLSRIPRELNREISRGSGEFMKNVRKSAKLRAPRDTSQLKDSIKLEKLKNGWIINVESPYGIYQEEGFKPHWVHSDMIKGSNKLKRQGFFWVEKSKPFIKPALEHNLSNLSNILSKSSKLAIQKAGR